MNPILKNILAVVAGLVVGSAANMGLIMIGESAITPPVGADATMEGLAAIMHLFEPKHFLFPFLAHGVGTLVGAYLAAMIAASRKMIFAIVIGVFFLIAGVYMVFILPSPMWFTATDLILAYLPMAWIGGKLATR